MTRELQSEIEEIGTEKTATEMGQKICTLLAERTTRYNKSRTVYRDGTTAYRTEMRETRTELGELRTSVQPLLAQSFVTTDLNLNIVTRNLVEEMTQEMIVQLEPRLVPVPRRRK